MPKSLLLLFLPLLAPESPGGESLTFNRDIRPILSDNCFACHGPNADSREAKLRLDVRESAVAKRRRASAIVPGDPEESELIYRILTDDEFDIMPPPETGKHLEPDEIDTIRRWIAQGAEYQEHWAFIAPIRSPLPDVDAQAWNTNPVDRFIHSNLTALGVDPAGMADPVTLVRRLYFDLTGLPPEPEAIDAFATDPSQGAYSELVDSLLASPHYGERMASYWLDLVRFADTQGFHSDDQQNIYPYRDYVISAFNSNMGFDRFTTEQLAGDLLENSTLEQRIASGYNRLNQVTGEGGAQPGEYLVKYTADRIRTTSEVWMGATLGCAECHDHKFDPFTARDFYQFGAIFADLEQVGVYSGKARSTGNYPPMMDVPQAAETKRLTELETRVSTLQADHKRLLDRLTAKIVAPAQSDWLLLVPDSARSSGASTMTRLEDGSVLSTGERSKRQNYTIAMPAPGPALGAIRLELLPDPSFKGLSRGNGNAVLSGFELNLLSATGKRRLEFSSIETGTKRNGEWQPEGVLDEDPKTGWGVYKEDGKTQATRSLVLRLNRPESLKDVESLEVVLRHEAERDFHNIGRFRLALSADPAAGPGGEARDERLLEAIGTPAAERSDSQTNRIHAHLALSEPAELDTAMEKIKAAESERDRFAISRTNTMVSRAGEPREIRILPRGDWLDDSGEVVQPGVPHFLPQPREPESGRLTRLDLAEWLMDEANPLTARVFVNRLWYLLFGHGLSDVLNDLGSQGEWPRHPELLDWLAVEFRESGWDIKHMVRLLVTSHTYQLSSAPSAAQLAADPLNRMHARQARFRLQAEFVRDNALAISGLLVRDPGGRSVKPYQPASYWSDSYKSVGHPHKYSQSHGADLYRRGMYTFWKRTYLHPSLLAFDAPSRESCEARRPISNTPLQALVLLNDPTYVEAARAFAMRAMLEAAGSPGERISWIMRQALGRYPEPAEVTALSELFGAQLARYQSNAADAEALAGVGEYKVPGTVDLVELAAWTAVTRVVLNLHETITRN